MSLKIPYTKPYICGTELGHISKTIAMGQLSGNGLFTNLCEDLISKMVDSKHALLTHSCTAALEISALLANIKPGDEIIMPAFTFVSTANAFVLRGGIPVFVDIRSDTQNIDESLIEEAISPKTKAIVVVHYAGVSCEMDTILDIAQKYELCLIEDNAQGVSASYKNKPLGSFGNLSCLSFHATKNIISGEGGALCINDESLISRAQIIREKGTNRNEFLLGNVDRYSWQDIGSSFLPSELISAFLFSQLNNAPLITENRISIWNNYHKILNTQQNKSLFKLGHVPDDCHHNGHIFYILLSESISRTRLINSMADRGIQLTSHYTPLHNSPAGIKYCKTSGSLKNTVHTANKIVRLPTWIGISNEEQEEICFNLLDLLVK